MTWNIAFLLAVLAAVLGMVGLVVPAYMLVGFLIGENIGWLTNELQHRKQREDEWR